MGDERHPRKPRMPLTIHDVESDDARRREQHRLVKLYADREKARQDQRAVLMSTLDDLRRRLGISGSCSTTAE